MDTKAPPTAS